MEGKYMIDVRTDIDNQLKDLFGKKEGDYYIIEDKITISCEDNNGSPFLWIEDRRGHDSFAWLFNIEKTDCGYKFYFDKYEYIECKTIQEVVDKVKARNYSNHAVSLS